MYPALAASYASVIFFVSFLLFGTYFMMSLIVAVLASTFIEANRVCYENPRKFECDVDHCGKILLGLIYRLDVINIVCSVPTN